MPQSPTLGEDSTAVVEKKTNKPLDIEPNSEGLIDGEFEGTEEGVPEGNGQEKAVSLTKQMEQMLMAGIPEDEIIAQGYNANSVRIVAYDLEKSGKRKRPSKAMTKTREGQLTGSKAMAPEALVDSLQVPAGVAPAFEQGMKFGMSCMVLGVRLAQEMSAIGIQQAKPLVEMAKDMRAGEVAAAKSATSEAASVAAEHIQQFIVPVLQSMDGRMNQLEVAQPTSKSDNPIGTMMAGMIQNMMKGMMGKMMPGMAQDDSPSLNWTRRSE